MKDSTETAFNFQITSLSLEQVATDRAKQHRIWTIQSMFDAAPEMCEFRRSRKRGRVH
jgi:hypothetical protein